MPATPIVTADAIGAFCRKYGDDHRIMMEAIVAILPTILPDQLESIVREVNSQRQLVGVNRVVHTPTSS